MARKREKLSRNRREIIEDENYIGHWTLAPETKRGIVIVFIFLVSFLGLLSMFEAAGAFGHYFSSGLAYLFGWADWLFLILLLFLGYALLNSEKYLIKLSNYFGLALVLASFCALFDFFIGASEYQDVVSLGRGGGALGYALGKLIQQFLGFWGALVALIALLTVGILLGFNTSFRAMVDRAKALGILKEKLLPSGGDEEDVPEEINEEEEFSTEEVNKEEVAIPVHKAEANQEEVVEQPVAKKPRKIIVPLELLTYSNSKPMSGDIDANMAKIKKTLENFGIEVEMSDVNVGPTVTQYTLRPAEGVKLAHILTLQNDLALALAAHPLRIEAPIPGKSLVGIEVPNQTVSIVKLREILESDEYRKRKNNLFISLGKDVAGTPKLANLGNMPHLLIAGATGSGKSVCVNNIILSLIYENSPDELKFILVDPKRVELSVYNNIPYLLTPVINEPDKTINALRWAVSEMEQRYKLLQAANKRNLESYNSAVIVNKLPYIVIIIDELADLMQTAAKEVEGAIIRLAQMARAVGIHLVLATQRPSTNVITGLIKANITSRIAFSVASNIDSRTIIDSAGAEKLLGKGDMLFMTAELTHPGRIQGAYVSDEEISAVVDYIKSQGGEPEYDPKIVEKIGHSHGVMGSSSGGNDYEDDLTMEAKEAVIKAGKASATLLQRRLRVGYARAARLLDILEEMGVVGPGDGAKPREVLVSQEELEENFSTELDETDLGEVDEVADLVDEEDDLEEEVQAKNF
jgi:S-DNA-T family DNA segregation ATPase FtsK/SpoIIIE